MAAALLETMTWLDAEASLRRETLVVIPLGAACKEHGPHLPLNTDWIIAEYLKEQILRLNADIVVTPTIGYNFFPAFKEYPGSVSIRLETARDLIVDLCASLAIHGPRCFYVVNTGISTLRALEPAKEMLIERGVTLRYSKWEELFKPVKHLIEQPGGSHADEVETSLLLHMAPQVVNMGKAKNEFNPGTGKLTRDPKAKKGVFSESGIWGDATLATVEKGKIFSDALVSGIVAEITEFIEDLQHL